tara:strand:- start:826 stop:1347 length:522 start_codon:yes stop_codon:yes gene_type:complete
MADATEKEKTKTFLKHDDYMTPKYAWTSIQQYIPQDKVIWEPFYGNGQSGQDLRDLGFDVIHEPKDFFSYTPEYDIVVSNPPFSKSKDVMNRLKELDKPFILIMPIPKLITSYFRENFKDTDTPLQLIIPRTRIHFVKHINGKPVDGWKPMCNFDCFYYCYKMNLPRDIMWLE